MISIICPVYNEEKYIARCIESIFNSDYPIGEMEVLFIDGMSTDHTRELVLEYVSRFTQIRLLDNLGRIVPSALNIGIGEAKGEIIFRIDAHAVYPSNYFSVLVGYLKKLKADNVGGVCQTLPINDSDVCVAIASALSSPFGMGNSYFRIGSNKIRRVDTVPFGCFRKGIFEEVGLFDEELVRNQDDEFNGRIIKNGGIIYLIPEIIVDYFARDSVIKVAKMFYQYGLFKPLVNKKLGSPATIRQFCPLLFVSGLIIGGILGIIIPFFFSIYWAVFGIYWLIAFYIAGTIAKKVQRFNIFLLLPFVFFIIHVSYGWGYIIGIYKILFRKSFLVKSNR